MIDENQGSPAPMNRRNFLGRSLMLLAAPILLPVLPAFARGSGAAAGAPGKTTINVRDKGARGDGKADDTSAIQAAIDALPASGGTVVIPAGNYMIDAARAIVLRSNMHLQMDDAAQLTAIPNGLKRYHVIKVWRASHVQITGGRIVGERDGHAGAGGEWGYGLNISGSNDVRVTGLHVSDCWGDGIIVGELGHGLGAQVSTNVVLDRVFSTNNRRQGLTISLVRGLTVTNSTFSNSNGTAPQAGIDMEPQSPLTASDITITGCTISGNRGTGLEMHKHVAGVVIKQCTIEDNAGYGVLGVGPSDLTIADNTVTGNGLAGVVMGGKTRDVKITGNTLDGNSARYMRRAIGAIKHLGKGGAHATELRVDPSTRNVTVSANKFAS